MILSDGETLSFEDKDVDSFDRYPIESTPFRVLLEPIVDLIKTATILDLYEGEELVVVTLQDRDDDSTGQMKIFFVVEGGELQLREWVITGPQGGDTRVELARVTRGEKLAADLFKLTPIIADLLNQRN